VLGDEAAHAFLGCAPRTFNITYGLLEDLDINIAIPIVTLDMGLDVTRQGTRPTPASGTPPSTRTRPTSRT
jgi:hypothetical protein